MQLRTSSLIERRMGELYIPCSKRKAEIEDEFKTCSFLIVFTFLAVIIILG